MWVLVVVVIAIFSHAVNIKCHVLEWRPPSVIKVILPVLISEIVVEFSLVEIRREVLVAVIVDVWVVYRLHLEGVNRVGCFKLLIVEVLTRLQYQVTRRQVQTLMRLFIVVIRTRVVIAFIVWLLLPVL